MRHSIKKILIWPLALESCQWPEIKLPNSKLHNSIVRSRALTTLPGHAQTPKYVEISQAISKGKENPLPIFNEPDTDMIGSVEIVEELLNDPSSTSGLEERQILL